MEGLDSCSDADWLSGCVRNGNGNFLFGLLVKRNKLTKYIFINNYYCKCMHIIIWDQNALSLCRHNLILI